MSDRGFSVSIDIGCFVMATIALSGMGIYADLGIGINTGAEDSVDEVTKDENVVNPSDGVDSDGGIIESVGSGLGIISTLSVWTAQMGSILQNIGLPSQLAVPIGTVALLTIAVSMAKFVRGLS